MSFLASLFGDTENAQRAAAADAKLREMNQARAAELGDAWKAQVDKNYSTQATFGVEAQTKEIDAAFGEGWNDGKKNISGAVSGFFKVIGDGLSSVLLGLPAWVWLAAGVFIWGWLGFPGLSALKKKLS